MGVFIESSGLTDRGLHRESNDDFLLRGDRKKLYIVADGVGGGEHGKVASKEAAEKMHETFNPSSPNVKAALLTAHAHVLSTNLRGETSGGTVLQKVRNDDYSHTTTLTGLHIDKRGIAHIAHVGDSRIYLLRGTNLAQLTMDHDVPGTTGLSQYVGDGKITPFVSRVETASEDLFLLCTDGLNRHVKDSVIREILYRCRTGELSLNAATRELIKEAKDRGGSDNITALLVRVSHVRNKPR